MSNISAFSNFIDSIKTKISSFLSHIKYSEKEGNYFENLNSSLNQKKKLYPLYSKSPQIYRFNNLNNNKISQDTKYKLIKNNENNMSNEDSRYKFIKINENNNKSNEASTYKLIKINEHNDFSIEDNFEQNYLGKKSKRINFTNNSINLNNEIIKDFYSSNDKNEIFNEDSFLQMSNNIILNKSINNMNINQTEEKEAKIEDSNEIDEKENIKKNKEEENFKKNEEKIIINNEEDEKVDNKNNNNDDTIDLNEIEININYSNPSLKNNPINNFLNNSRKFKSVFALSHDSFSYNNCNKSKKNIPAINLVFKKENEFSYKMLGNNNKEQTNNNIKDINNENNHKIIIKDNNDNNTFLLPNNNNEKETYKININRFTKRSHLFGNNENKNKKNIKSPINSNNTKNIFLGKLEDKVKTKSNLCNINLSKKSNSIMENNDDLNKDNNLNMKDIRKNKSFPKDGIFGNVQENENNFGNSELFGISETSGKNSSLFSNIAKKDNKSV